MIKFYRSFQIFISNDWHLQAREKINIPQCLFEQYSKMNPETNDTLYESSDRSFRNQKENWASQPVNSNLNKKLAPKQKTIQAFYIWALGLRKRSYQLTSPGHRYRVRHKDWDALF